MLAFFAENSGWAIALALMVGLLVGSFLNVVILRLPVRLDWEWRQEAREVLGLPDVYEPKPAGLAIERSACPSCGHTLSAWENIPLLSFMLLRGKCSACKTSISWQYPLIELITGVLFAVCIWRFGFSLQGGLACVFTAGLVALSGIDLRTTLLPDQITQPLLWLGLLISLITVFVDPTSALLGAAFGYLSLWSVTKLFKLITGKDGMGAGDFKLLAALGAWLGLSMVLPVVLGASVIGAVVGIGMKLASTLREGRYVPFGPFLAGSGLAVLFIGAPTIFDWLGWA